jgi:hypothetical protein
MAQQGVPVSAAAAALGHDPAIFLPTYAHLYPDDLKSVAAAMETARQAATEAACEAPSVSRVDFAGTSCRRRSNSERFRCVVTVQFSSVVDTSQMNPSRIEIGTV